MAMLAERCEEEEVTQSVECSEMEPSLETQLLIQKELHFEKKVVTGAKKKQLNFYEKEQ